MPSRSASFSLIATLITSMSLCASSQAGILYSETFTYPDGGLIGQGGWAIVGASVVSPITVTGGVVGPIAATGQDVTNDFSAPAVLAGSVYLAADLNITTANATGEYFLHLTQQGSTSAFPGRIFAKSAAGGFQFGISTSSIGAGTPPAAGPAAYGATLGFGTYHVVLRYDIVSGVTNDTVAFYVAPTSSIEGSNTPYIATVNTGGTDVDPLIGIGQVNIRQGTTGPATTIDNIIISDDFASASAVAALPEPSTYALGAIAGLGFLGYRLRRKQSLLLV